MKQTIAIIGATGKIGSALAKSLAGGNYRLLLKSRNEAALEQLVQTINTANPKADVEGMACTKEACWEADIIIPAVPYAAQTLVAETIREVSFQKIIISMTNPLSKSFTGLVTSGTRSAAEELQALLPQAKIVKAFNTIGANDFTNTTTGGQPVNTYLAGNDAEALQTVSQLVRTAGFCPVVVGELSESRRLEGLLLKQHQEIQTA